MRITKQIRDEILTKIGEKMLSKELKAKIEASIGEELRKLLEPQFLPGWEKYKKHISVDSSIYVSGYGSIPSNVPQYYNCEDYPGRGVTFSCCEFKELPDTIKDIINSYSDLLYETQAKIDNIRNVLLSCNTTKRLVELVPEMAAFIPEEQSNNLPIPVGAIDNVRQVLEDIKGGHHA